MRVVLDTNVLVAALRSRQGASHQLIRRLVVEPGSFVPLLSVPLFLEYEAVLKRRTGGIPLGAEEVDVFLDVLASIGEEVRLYYLWRPSLADPDDDMVLELAVAGGADAIVTFNVRDFDPFAQRFGVKVLRPRDLWLQLRENTP